MTGATTPPEECPRLRPVEAFPIQFQQDRMIGLRDPEQLAGEELFLSQPAFFIVSRLNGRESLRDIQAAFFRQFGEIIPMDRIQELVQTLDEKRFLETTSFREFRSRRVEEFRRQDFRPARHAGAAYESDPQQLRHQIDGYFEHPEGMSPGPRPAAQETLRGLIAPHIDLHRGGPVYSWAYGVLRDAPAHDLYVILGTSHAPLPQPYCITAKEFQTPLGSVPSDRDLVPQLCAAAAFDLLEGEWVHRSEHSIEFQAVFLKYLFPDRPFTILPILCGNILQDCAGASELPADSQVQPFLELLADTVARSGRRACFIAAADLAHLGPRFGDPEPVTPELLNWLRAKDLEMLHRVERMEGKAFLEGIIAEGDRRRICGLAPIFSLLGVCGAKEGRLLSYGQAPGPQGSQVVSYASMAFV